MKFRAATIIFALLVAFGITTDRSFAQQPIQITATNQHLFLIIKGSLGLACHRPVGATATLYGEIETIQNPDGTTQRLFIDRGRPYVQKLQRKYNAQILTLKARYQKERNRNAARAILNQIKAKLKLRLAAFKQARSALNGCKAFTPGTPPDLPPPPPADDPEDPDEELPFEDSPFPQRQSNVDGTVKLDPAEDSIVFYVSYRGNDAENGLSPEAAVRTYARAWQLLNQASSNGVTPHQIRFERGGVYDDELLFMSGWSSEVPFVIGDYGPTNLQRPAMLRPVQINGSLKNIAITGLLFYNRARDPYSPAFNPNAPDLAAIRINGGVSRILIQLSSFRTYTTGIFISGAGDTGTQLARRVASIRNSFVDLYAKNGQLNGWAGGVYANNVNGLNVTGCVFARHGNPLGLSSESGNTGQTGLPVIQPDSKAIGVHVDQRAKSYVVVRDSQFIAGFTGIKINGYILDRFGQLDGQLGTVEIYSNVFYEMSHGIRTDTPAVTLYDNAVVHPLRRPLSPFVSGFMIENASAIDAYRNVFMNSLSDGQGKDRGIYVFGHADFAYHRILQNKFLNIPGAIIYGNLTWYDSLWFDGPFGPRQIPINRGPESITIANNVIVNSDDRQALIEVKQQDRGINEMIFRSNILWNPNLAGRLWASEEHGTITRVENVYEEIPIYCDNPILPYCGFNIFAPECQACLNPACLYTEITRSPNTRMTSSNWYANVGAGFVIPGGSVYPVIGSWNPNRIAIPCGSNVSVGMAHYLNLEMNQQQWFQFINRNGQNEVPPGAEGGLRVEPVTFRAPQRTLLTFLADNDIQVRIPAGSPLAPAVSVDAYIDYLVNFWQHTPSEDLSLDPRTWGKNVQTYFAGGLDIITP